MSKARNYREWSTIDKGDWGRGMWTDEPDKVQWIDEATGLDCLLHRGPGGHWCGYVGVGPDHPWHGLDYGQCVMGEGCDAPEEERWYCDHRPDSILDVHGGITFASACADTDDESTGICHIAEPGRPDHVWWFGFDCAHSGDLSPKYDSEYGRLSSYSTYKGRGYVETEVRRLAQQLAARATP